ncbi:hypothetical protein PCANB_000804 [Pneumocystis canis]|nr:hypothetical protein PCANB_000804 [Pneumocystis canis]
MQREAYTPSILTDQSIETPHFATRSVQMVYLCAGMFDIIHIQKMREKTENPLLISSFQDCGAANQIQTREVIRCRECGHRVMYKQRCYKYTKFSSVEQYRTKRMIQFEAR